MECKGKGAMFIEMPYVSGGLNLFLPKYNFDYKKMVELLENRFGISIYLKTVYMPNPETSGKYNHFIRLRDSLSYMGFCIKTKEGIIQKNSDTGETQTKCNFDSKISIDMYKLAIQGKVDYIILFAGDIDYIDVIEEVHDLGINMIVIGFQNTYSEIKNAADNFITFETLKDEIALSFKSSAGNGKNLDKDKGKKIEKPEIIKTFVVDEYWSAYYKADNIENISSYFIY